MTRKPHVVIVGLGYVGLPLANAFQKTGNYIVTGVDINEARVAELSTQLDSNGDEIPEKGILFTTKMPNDGDYYIVTVPTPVHSNSEIDLRPLVSASASVGAAIRDSAYNEVKPMVIYESTVHPTCTREECIPVLERESFLKAGRDFYVGYSPERVSPSETHVTKIAKLVSSNDGPEAVQRIYNLYASILEKEPVLAASIEVAEAAKMLENTQRDVLIALINEFSVLCHAIGLDANEVVDAASSKWNFAALRPGLVGGHCIGVDPYYLLSLAKAKNVDMPLVTKSRYTNSVRLPSELSRWIESVVEERNTHNALVLGYTFKPDVADVRNTGVKTLIASLSYARSGSHLFKEISVYDPMVSVSAEREVSRELASIGDQFVFFTRNPYVLTPVHTVIYTVNHKLFADTLHHLLTSLKTQVFIDPFGKVDPSTLPEGVKYLRY